MSEYAVVITYQLEGERVKSILLDTVNDVQVNGRSTLTTMPLVNGDEVSDHMFRNPSTLTISGSCSLNGSKITIIDGEGSKLANFEELIDKIRKQGVRCNIVKISVDDEKNIRFLQRANMVLNNSTISEKINSLDFTLNFTQILTSEIITLDVDEDDQFLPYITQPRTLSFADTTLNKEQILEDTIKILKEEGLISESFLGVMANVNWGKFAVGSVAAMAGAVIASYAAVCASNPVGWVIGAISVFAVGIYLIFKAIADAIAAAKRRQKYIIEIFDWREGEDEKNEQNQERFLDFMTEIYNELNSLDNLFHLYSITSNEPQEVMLSIDDDYYIFTFTWDNVGSNWKVKVLKNNDEDYQINVGDKENLSSSVSGLDELTSSNYLFKTEQSRRVYIINSSEDKTDLTGYQILVCDVNPEEINKKINQIIKSHIFRNADSQ